jgi:hypothetical protein
MLSVKIHFWHLDIRHNDTQHNDIRHNVTQQNDIQFKSKIMTLNPYALCCYAECHNQVHYAECRGASLFMRLSIFSSRHLSTLLALQPAPSTSAGEASSSLPSRAQCYKTFHGRNLRIFVIS